MEGFLTMITFVVSQILMGIPNVAIQNLLKMEMLKGNTIQY